MCMARPMPRLENMKMLKTYPQCAECIISLANTVAEMTAPGDPVFAHDAEIMARKILEESKAKGSNAPQAANKILNNIRELTGVFDPYHDFKAQEMVQAQGIINQVQDVVGSELRPRVSLAALGNSLDFFMDPAKALTEIPDRLQTGLSFYHDDVPRLEAFLSQDPGTILYLTDNTGEVLFDLPLYDYIKARADRTVLVVKGGPSLNDLTRRELQQAGLESSFDEIADTGVDGVGIEWDRVSGDFLDLVAEADLILSKGMANFETIYTRKLSSPAFFIFKAKCAPIEDYIKAPADSFQALWRDA